MGGYVGYLHSHMCYTVLINNYDCLQTVSLDRDPM
jgi:hypothetical protein